jgi:hypothetical protein
MKPGTTECSLRVRSQVTFSVPIDCPPTNTVHILDHHTQDSPHEQTHSRKQMGLVPSADGILCTRAVTSFRILPAGRTMLSKVPLPTQALPSIAFLVS